MPNLRVPEGVAVLGLVQTNVVPGLCLWACPHHAGLAGPAAKRLRLGSWLAWGTSLWMGALMQRAQARCPALLRAAPVLLVQCGGVYLSPQMVKARGAFQDPNLGPQTRKSPWLQPVPQRWRTNPVQVSLSTAAWWVRPMTGDVAWTWSCRNGLICGELVLQRRR